MPMRRAAWVSCAHLRLVVHAAVSNSDLQNEILAKCSRGDTRLFRINSGNAWQGDVVKHDGSILILRNPRAVRLAPMGFADLAGWTTVAVAGDGGLDRAAIFTGMECKMGSGRASKEQRAFLDIVRAAGGRSGIARSVEDARLILAGGNP